MREFYNNLFAEKREVGLCLWLIVCCNAGFHKDYFSRYVVEVLYEKNLDYVNSWRTQKGHFKSSGEPAKPRAMQEVLETARNRDYWKTKINAQSM